MTTAEAPAPRARSRRNPYVTRAAALCGIGGLLFGYDTGVIGGALPLIAKHFHLNSPFQKGLVTASLLLGAALGAYIAGHYSDRLGRKRLILITALTFIVGLIGATLSTSTAMLIIFRVVIGLGVGSASVVVPLYISEIAPPDRRGSLVSLNQLAITSGILISQLISYFLASSGNWRLMIGLALVPSALLLFGMIPQPESPHWLVEQHREDEARVILGRARDDQGDIDDEVREVREVSAKRADAHALLARSLRPALVIGVMLAVIQQVTGINTVIYYAPTLLEQAGLGQHAALGGTVIIGLINVIMTIVAIGLLDRSGRRPLLLGGTLGMVVGLVVLGASFIGQGSHIGKGHAIIAIAALCVYVGSFAIGLGPVFWLLISEIYPLRVRGSAMSVAGIANWLANFVVAISYLSILAAIGKTATFWLYAALAIGSYLFMKIKVPETKGRSLADIEGELGSSSSYPDEPGGPGPGNGSGSRTLRRRATTS